MKMSFIISASMLLLTFSSITSEVVDFSKCRPFFFNGTPPVIPGILENSSSLDNQYKTICQKLGGLYRFATLYSTKNRIPVFSAYNYITENHPNRPANEWKVEPQLEKSSDEMGTPYIYQAIDEDFENNNENLSRGHLFPCCHAGDEDTARATFTLTNIVPQKISFNRGSWNRMEINVSKVMAEICCDPQNNILAYVLTGAVPGDRMLNQRVNIPSLMWMTFCCYNIHTQSWFSQAYYAENEDEYSNNVIIEERSLQELQQFLSTQWTNITQLFHNNCEN